MLKRHQVVEHRGVEALKDIVEHMLLDAVHVVLPGFLLLDLVVGGLVAGVDGWGHQSCFLFQVGILHHEEFIGYHKHGGLVSFRTRSVERLVKDNPSWIIDFTFLSDVHHCGKQHSVLAGDRVGQVEESEVLVLNVSLLSL